MVNVMLFEVSAVVPPPYMPPAIPGFVTVIVTIPAFAIAALGIVATTWPAPIHVVVWAVPFQLMAAFPPKLEPLTVSTKAGPPAFILAGESAAIAGVVPAVGGVVAFEL